MEVKVWKVVAIFLVLVVISLSTMVYIGYLNQQANSLVLEKEGIIKENIQLADKVNNLLDEVDDIEMSQSICQGDLSNLAKVCVLPTPCSDKKEVSLKSELLECLASYHNEETDLLSCTANLLALNMTLNQTEESLGLCQHENSKNKGGITLSAFTYTTSTDGKVSMTQNGWYCQNTPIIDTDSLPSGGYQQVMIK